MTPAELRAARERLGLRPEQLAQRLGLSKRTVQRMEAGQARIRPSDAALVRQLLDAHAMLRGE